jgi:DNA-binding NarL/FixJ family response regulator
LANKVLKPWSSAVRGQVSLRRRNEELSAMLSLEQIKITRRDQDVLKLLVEGCSNKEIAAELKISPRT